MQEELKYFTEMVSLWFLFILKFKDQNKNLLMSDNIYYPADQGYQNKRKMNLQYQVRSIFLF
jgi:hypothetical protein